MQSISEFQAIEYVKRMESDWELPVCRAFHVSRHADKSIYALDVRTDSNLWTVWIEHDGSVYGEC